MLSMGHPIRPVIFWVLSATLIAILSCRIVHLELEVRVLTQQLDSANQARLSNANELVTRLKP